MSFQLDRTKSVCKSIRRIAKSEISNAIAELSDQPINRHEVIHRVRVRCKKLRALIRLVRPALGRTYQIENNHFRDAAQLLSSFRDAKVMLNTYDDAISRSTQCKVESAHPIRELLDRSVNELDNDEIDRRMAEFKDALLVVNERVNNWKLATNGFDLITAGFQRTHEQAIHCLNEALQHQTSESLHDFRKHAKYHSYHMRLLQPVWPKMFQPYIDQLNLVSELLGNEHNIAVLRETWLDVPEPVATKLEISRFRAVIDGRSTQLVTEALPLAKFLFAESSKSFVKRMRAYWKLWRN